MHICKQLKSYIINTHLTYKYFYLICCLLLSCVTNPDECGIGFTKINDQCYNDQDISVLQEIADYNNITNPLSLSTLKWNDDGRLIELWLHGDTLLGNIPTRIGDLEYLVKLNLGNNLFTGPIPESIGNLENLNYLYLHINELSGTIPDSICNIYPNMEHFWIQYNSLCPPYPECIPNSEIFPQDITNCP